MNGPAIHSPHRRAAPASPRRPSTGAEGHSVDLAETLTSMLARDSVRDAARVAVDHLPARLGSVRMAIATCEPNAACTLQAISGVAALDRRAELVRSFEAALDETLLHGSELIYVRGRSAPVPAKTLEHLGGQLGCGWLVSCPMRDPQGRVSGAWLFWGETLDALRATANVMESAERPVAASLRTIVRANHSATARVRRSLAEKLDSRRKRRLITTAAACIVGLALLPVPYKLRCDCTVEPVVRRYVAAPFDTTLERTLVTPGDVVRQGELLATLDGRELRWELAALEADYQQAQKARDAALADRKTADVQLARLEMQQLQNRINLLESRQNQLEVRAPLDGVVVSGDLQRVEGAPLATGQTMFEIAPLDAVIVEVAIPEAEISYVEVGDPVAVRLDAAAGRRYRGLVDRLHPKAELRDGEQVFLAEVELANEDGALRPGMGGRAKVSGPMSSLSWVLFHRPWETATRWLGW